LVIYKKYDNKYKILEKIVIHIWELWITAKADVKENTCKNVSQIFCFFSQSSRNDVYDGK